MTAKPTDSSERHIWRGFLFVFGCLVAAAGIFRTSGGDPLRDILLGIGVFSAVLAALVPFIESLTVSQGALSVKTHTRLPPAPEATSRYADPDASALPIKHENDAAESANGARYLAAVAALHGLLYPPRDPLADCQFVVYLYDADEDELLAAFFDETLPEPPSWEVGRGATGIAYDEGTYMLAVGAEARDPAYGLSEAELERHASAAVVAAMPVFNGSGDVIAVLSGTSQDPQSTLATPDGFNLHLSLAEAVARILIDLLGWFRDE
jgi:hypothetical protein